MALTTVEREDLIAATLGKLTTELEAHVTNLRSELANEGVETNYDEVSPDIMVLMAIENTASDVAKNNQYSDDELTKKVLLSSAEESIRCMIVVA